jgi:hypothetical protein
MCGNNMMKSLSRYNLVCSNKNDLDMGKLVTKVEWLQLLIIENVPEVERMCYLLELGR